MEKSRSLRSALESALPEFRREPDRLRMWVEDGAAQHRQTATLAFAFRYRLNVLLVECATDLALVALPLFRWLRVNQPDLLAPGRDGFTFDADILDNKTADVLIQLELTDCVTVSPLEDGGWSLDYLPEPDPMFPDFDPPGGLGEIANLSDVVTDTSQDGG